MVKRWENQTQVAKGEVGLGLDRIEHCRKQE